MIEETPSGPVAHPKHLARDRFGKGALQAAHDVTRALAEAGVEDDGVVVLRTDGPRHSLAALENLLDEVLAEDDPDSGAPTSGTGERPGDAGDDPHRRP